MGIAKKYRRKLVIGERLFLWWVREIQPEDWLGPVLTVASDDKRFLVRYYLGQKEEQRFLVVLGPEFPGLPDAGGCWIRVLCPQWESGSSVQPSDASPLDRLVLVHSAAFSASRLARSIACRRGHRRTRIRFSLSRDNNFHGHGVSAFSGRLFLRGQGSGGEGHRSATRLVLSQADAAPGPEGRGRAAPNTHADSGGPAPRGQAAVPGNKPRPVPILIRSRSRGHSRAAGSSPPRERPVR